jgi:nucleoid-associated protein YgaU
VWGGLAFTCVLARASQRYTMFRPDGVPVRARLQVTLNEYVDPREEEKDEPNQTADYSKVHLVRQGETLSAIAGRAYEDAALWRPIARHNGLVDPRALQVGQRLLIPRLPYRDPETGEVYR